MSHAPVPVPPTRSNETATHVAPVVFVPDEDGMAGHRARAAEALARRIARLRSSAFLDLAEAMAARLRCYAVPAATLVGGQRAAELGVEHETDLFGGVVAYAVQAGKAITHALIDDDAGRPEGWSTGFGAAVREVVPTGYSAFEAASARRAGRHLLEAGPVRLKPGWADGGHEQSIVADTAALDTVIAALDAEALAAHGLVLEENLADAIVFSIGRVRIGATILSYVGRQGTTVDNRGAIAYGGSTLTVVPGEFEQLMALDLDAAARRAVACALTYDRAAMEHFPGLIASRRNYDVIAGRSAGGAPRTGVLEQSWRIGGASGAEIAAFEAFAQAPDLVSVRTSCTERYGATHEPPKGSFVYYRGDDPEVGPVIKYATLEARARAS